MDESTAENHNENLLISGLFVVIVTSNVIFIIAETEVNPVLNESLDLEQGMSTINYKHVVIIVVHVYKISLISWSEKSILLKICTVKLNF